MIDKRGGWRMASNGWSKGEIVEFKTTTVEEQFQNKNTKNDWAMMSECEFAGVQHFVAHFGARY